MEQNKLTDQDTTHRTTYNLAVQQETI